MVLKHNIWLWKPVWILSTREDPESARNPDALLKGQHTHPGLWWREEGADQRGLKLSEDWVVQLQGKIWRADSHLC